MNAPLRRSMLMSVADELLVDVAIKIQLPPSLYDLAMERFQTIAEWMERPDSPLRGLIDQIHAQGSIRIGSTIRSRQDEDMFDVDMIVELLISPDTAPETVLDLIEDALAGAEGARYWNKTKRQTRCITVEYAEMHIDITPLVRLQAKPERVGHIFHAKQGTPRSLHRSIEANPWGFGQWYIQRTPADGWFGDFLLEKSIARDGFLRKQADVEKPPARQEVYRKARATVALQLIKRHIQIIYERRPDMRRPPSVAVSCVVGWNSGGDRSLLDEVIHQAQALRTVLAHAQAIATRAQIRNPRWEPDLFTDRWPEDLDAQRLFIGDLDRFIAALEEARYARPEDLQSIFSKLFGERVTGAVLADRAARERASYSASRPGVDPRSGRVVLGPSLTAPSLIRPRKQTYFGSD